MFYIVALGVWMVIHIYVGHRIITPMGLDLLPKLAAWFLVLASYVMVPLVFSMRLGSPKPFWYVPLFWFTFIMFGYVTTIFPLLMTKDVVMWSWTKMGTYSSLNSQQGSVGAPDEKHRQRQVTHQMNMGVMAITLALVLMGMYQAGIAPQVKVVETPVEGLAEGLDGLKIALISDIHISPTVHGDTVADIVRRVNELEPDIVAHTGDLADATVEEMGKDAEPLSGLKAKLGVFFVTGNHEYYWDLKGWLKVVENTGAVALNNEHRLVEHNGARLLVAGITDYSAGGSAPGHKSDPAKALTGAPKRDFTLMLAHQPRSVVAVAATGQVDLQLSGHTHGGQYFPWSIIVRFVHPVAPGLSKYEGMWVYLSRGSVYWGPPLRLGSPKEITLIVLRRAEKMRATGS
ncbi:MAG: metallophosphoesterase [Nitrospinota bacterium]|nr:metallophosphoesterase [Nitrospinota bacterium]